MNGNTGTEWENGDYLEQQGGIYRRNENLTDEGEFLRGRRTET